MSDNKAKTGKEDRERINVDEEYELRDWADHFQVDQETLRAVVKKVGPMVKDVERELTGSAT
jgi:hypothetical protein